MFSYIIFMTGDTIDIDHRSVDWSRDTITTSGGAWLDRRRRQSRLVEHQLHWISLLTQVGTRTSHRLQKGRRIVYVRYETY